jgi:hypothetical protein
MRLVAHALIGLALRRYRRRRLADRYAILIADVGLTRAEQEAFLTLRNRR